MLFGALKSPKAKTGQLKRFFKSLQSVSSIEINPDAVDTEDITMLEDLILAALSDAYKKADEMSASKMGAFGPMGL